MPLTAIIVARRLFGVKCAGCLGSIAPSELVMRALEHVFHVACFACVVCGRTLQKGDQFVVRSARLYCRPDFEKEMALVSMAAHQQHGTPGVPPVAGNTARGTYLRRFFARPRCFFIASSSTCISRWMRGNAIMSCHPNTGSSKPRSLKKRETSFA